MSTQTAAKISYRKTGKGEWVAYGPASQIIAGTTVTVTKASGETKTELVESVGRSFTANGQQMVYGYLAKSAPPVRRSYGPDVNGNRRAARISASRELREDICGF